MIPAIQFFPTAPTTNFTLPAALVGASKSLVVRVNGRRAPFRFTSGTAIALATAAPAGSIVDVFVVDEESDSRAAGEVSLNFPSVAAAGVQDLTVSVPGASVGDAVALGLSAFPNTGIILSARVSAADTVTVRAHNVTAGAIDPPAITVRVVVIKA